MDPKFRSSPMNVRVVLLASAGALVALAAGFLGTLRGQEAKAPVLRPCVAWSGGTSAVQAREFARVRTPEAWAALWARHTGADPKQAEDAYYNPAGAPWIDFERFEVVAVFQGKKWNSAGVDCVSLAEEEGRVVLRFDDRSFQTLGGAVEASPFGLFVIARSDKPVAFEENVQSLKGQPPVWKERARLEAAR
jgi:hypothetical protein